MRGSAGSKESEQVTRSIDHIRLRKAPVITAFAIFLAFFTAGPASALVGNNSVNSTSIINGQVKAADIAKAAIKTAKLANNAVTSAKIADGTIINADISAAAAISASKINRAGLNADLLDGLNSSAFSTTGHNHDGAYVNDNAGEIDDADIADGAIALSKLAEAVWTSTYDGSGTGLDADMLDGLDSADFAGSSHNHDAFYMADDAFAVDNADIANGAISATKIADTAWTAENDGPGSGLDADTLDGVDSANLLTNAGTQTVGGDVVASDFAYSSAKTRYLTIPAHAFTPEQSTTQYVRFFNYLKLDDPTQSSRQFQAPVYLPDGATVTNARLQAIDNYAGGVASFQLIRWSTAGGFGDSLAFGTTSGAESPAWRNFDAGAGATIDNANHNYYHVNLMWNAAAGINIIVGGVVITYTVPGP